MLLLTACSALWGVAQQFPVMDNYLVDPLSISPAFAGKNYPFEAFVTHRSSWTALEGSPVTGMITLDGQINPKMGIGGSVTLNKAGIFRNFAGNLSYAYHLQVAKAHFISFGISAALYQNSIDFSSIVVKDPNDPMFGSNDYLTETYFNAGLSLLYNWKDLNFCISLPILFNNKSLYHASAYEQVLTLDRNWLIYANYSLRLARDWKLRFDALYRDTQFNPLSFDISAMVRFQDSYWLGAFYRKNSIIGVTAGLSIARSLVINYNFEFSGTSMEGQGGGTHEVTLGYTLFRNKESKSGMPQIIDYKQSH